MEVMEVYVAPQGEGRNIGTPSIFLRLQGCPVGCSWCDIKPSWDFKTDDSKTMTPGEIYSVIESISDLKIDHVVITGGEPLMQRAELEKLVAMLLRNFHVEIETSGVYAPLSLSAPQYNVSPKLASAASKIKPSDRLLDYLDEDAIFKFVVRDEVDFAEARQLADKYGISYGRIYLMPEGVSSSVIIDRMRWLESQILSEWPQVNMTTRLHILMHENERKR